MRVFWREVRRGQRLVLSGGDSEDDEKEIGGVRETKSGFDAFAKTFGYEPGRAEKGLASMEEARAFVESFTPWDLYQGTEGLTADPGVEPPRQ